MNHVQLDVKKGFGRSKGNINLMLKVKRKSTTYVVCITTYFCRKLASYRSWFSSLIHSIECLCGKSWTASIWVNMVWCTILWLYPKKQIPIYVLSCEIYWKSKYPIGRQQKWKYLSEIPKFQKFSNPDQQNWILIANRVRVDIVIFERQYDLPM